MSKSHSDYHAYTTEFIDSLKVLKLGRSRAETVKAIEKKLGITDRQARRVYAKYVEGDAVSAQITDYSVINIDPSTQTKTVVKAAAPDVARTEVARPVRRYVWFIEPYYTLEIDNDSIRIISSSKHAKGRELSVFFSPDGYHKVKMNNKGVMIHHLVAHVVLGPRPEGLVINHKDGIKTNNRPENLEYVTQAENIQHAIDHGLHVASDPTRMPTYKDGRCKDKVSYKRAWRDERRKQGLPVT